ncbi:uncharacterized protein PHACADRAFT_263474 [Phanerochaete carnosa HHB-10118-sp]|uniref:Uncharacterized protein n=1 Tax=Phanerochaete carnosa (strain HHB-10118-sp) TaxID=650164 RepID=K5UNQ9_PHACS|nr:uncharacterized protein PHACADRAFT_263474 [Phanerochaete carnosa HHB-10118-sp]EKM51381.1 hypothetical protein PHACADRAFT_263474 [Phanerochaete carnosa HHB-10118-sp]
MLRRIFLVDVVDNILLHAEYFAVLSRKGEKTVVEDDDHVRVLSFPMNKTLRESIRRVTVRIYGHDQGPSAYLQDQGSRDKSWTWYTLKSGQWEEEIARNSRTVLEPKAHVWTCKEGDSEMTHIRQGDEIEVWAHAK